MTTLALTCAEFKANITAGLLSMLETEQYANVTIAVEGKYLKAHQMVLSICSPYFDALLQSAPCKHPIIFIKNVKYNIMKHLLRFMYEGQTQIVGEDFELFIETAQELQIKWLMKGNEQNVGTTASASNDSSSAKRLRQPSTAEQFTPQTTIDLSEPAAPSVAERVAKRPKVLHQERNPTTSGCNDIPPGIKLEKAFDLFQEEYMETSDRIENRNDDLSAISEIATDAERFFAEPIDKTFDPRVVNLDDLPIHVKQEKGEGHADVASFHNDNQHGELFQPLEPVPRTSMPPFTAKDGQPGTTIQSKKGRNLIVLEGYTFSFQKKMNDLKERWKCCQRGCLSYLHTSANGAEILVAKMEHNHKNNLNIMRQRLRGILKQAATKSLYERPGALLNRELETAGPYVIDDSDIASVKRSMYYARKKIISTIPKDIMELHQFLDTAHVSQ